MLGILIETHPTRIFAITDTSFDISFAKTLSRVPQIIQINFSFNFKQGTKKSAFINYVKIFSKFEHFFNLYLQIILNFLLQLSSF